MCFFSFIKPKIKVSKVESNLNVDRQKEIFQSVGFVQEGEGEEFIMKAESLCGHESLNFY